MAEEIQKNAKKHIDQLVEDARDFVKNVQAKKTLEERELRVVSMGLLAIWTFLAVLVPGVLRTLLGGFSFTDDYDSIRVTHEFIRLTGAFSFALLLINFLGSRWSGEAKSDLSRIMAFFNCLVAAVVLIIIMSGGSFMYYLTLPIAGGLAFFYGKDAKLF
ncbi:hypothetical protein ABK040_008191 [Willaertia magna]